MDEQIDKNTGAQVSAQALTWSYANVRNLTICFVWSRYHVCLHFHPHLAHHDDEQPLTTINNLMPRSSTPCTPRRELPRWWKISTCRTCAANVLAIISSLKTFPPKSNGFLPFYMCKSSNTLYNTIHYPMQSIS